MIQLIGIKSGCNLDVRQKFSIIPSHIDENIKELYILVNEVAILSTCNRTEIYVDSEMNKSTLIYHVFKTLKWDMAYIENTFYIEGDSAIKHLMEVSSGFHSRILGEDQILGQIKNAYDIARKNNSIKGNLQRLFQVAITCGKKFRTCSEIYKIPVSVSSIATKTALNMGIKSFMILGYGEIGKLTLNYLENNNVDIIYIAVRNIENTLKTLLFNEKVKLISFKEKEKYYSRVQCIISCTSAPHIIINIKDLPDKELLIFDMAVPRDVDRSVANLKKITLYDIDSISTIDEENKLRRKEKMESCKYIIDDYINEYKKWLSIQKLSPEIQKLKTFGDKVANDRITSFKNKKNTKDNEKFVEILLKSASNVYVNRAINALKEEKLEGREEECLRIIQKIFYPQM